MDRRTFLLKRGTIVLAAISSLSFPSITKAYNRNPAIRVPRHTRDAQEVIRQQAQKELGINIEFYPVGDAEVLLKTSIDPGNFDIYAQWSDSIKILWMANAIQPINIKKLKYLNYINFLSKI